LVHQIFGERATLTRTIENGILSRIDLLQKTITGFRLPRPLTVFRGVKNAEATFGTITRGDIIDYGALSFKSTSMELSIASESFSSVLSGCCLLRIHLKRGDTALPLLGSVSANKFSQTSFTDEAEVLLPMHTIFRVRSVQEETMSATGMLYHGMQYTMKVIDVVIHSQKTYPISHIPKTIHESTTSDQLQLRSLMDTQIHTSRLLARKLVKMCPTLRDKDVCVHGDRVYIETRKELPVTHVRLDGTH
jgi:hypothetical protein